MKLTKSTYFSFFFLFCFLASFSTAVYKNLHSVSNEIKHKNNFSVILSSKQQSSSSIPDFLCEETEDENENVFYTQLISIPFFIAFYLLDFINTNHISAKPLAETTSPIYITFCNLRL